MKGHKIYYSHDELDFIESNKSMVRRESHALFVEKFGRDDVSLINYNALCKRNGWWTGRTGRFKKGQESFNKGRNQSEWMSAESIAKAKHTQFKPGCIPHNANFEGHERITKDGYIEISVNKKNKHTGFERSYVLKHKWEWEKIHGQVPAGYCLKCLDGNKQNTSPDNWGLISRKLLPRIARTNFDALPNQLKPIALNVAKLEVLANDH